jgi:hypothetical protein
VAQHQVTVTCRLNSEGEFTDSVLQTSSVETVVISGSRDKEIESLYRKLCTLVNSEVLTTSLPTQQINSKTSRDTDDRLKLLVEMGYDEFVASSALKQCGTNTQIEDVVSWLLEHESSVKLQLDYDSDYFTLGKGGIDNVFMRENKKLENDLCTIKSGSLTADPSRAKEIKGLADEIYARRRLNGETVDDIMESMMFKASQIHLFIGRLSEKGLKRNVYTEEMARQIDHLLLHCTNSTQGAISVSEAYRLFNRCRSRDFIAPEDFMEACSVLDKVSIALRFSKRSNAIFFRDFESHIQEAVISCISSSNSGITKLYAATMTKLPIGVVNLHLKEAEEQGLVVRDETPHGVLYYVNMFGRFTYP